MNREKKLQLMEWSKFLWIFVFAALYSWGGIEMKWLRRYLAPAVLTGGMYFYCRDWKVIFQLPLQMLTLSMGYGADTFWAKVGRRALWGLANGCSSITYHTLDLFSNVEYKKVTGFYKQWLGVAIFQLTLILNASILFGVLNPFPARAEEFTIGVFLAFIPMIGTDIKGAY